ncbi:uncharacterized protein EV420DRAFT_1501042 [Desarmillaria tabescens]|uniref:Uncharacterized protein n=1 Tax=Armillaria tabescens TaxID=1929756 RepID=A0AA39NL89_ARMTA|nr:uncharacterized protein EV420DRAFT_1501042 [Desarmillaria tabescens]KAK0467722.1 hypothetical protein EV420DRAFT_1501042 [Desarmillaria tabescens]
MGSTAPIVQRLITPLIEWKFLASLITDIQLDIPVPSFTWTMYDYPAQDTGSDFLSRVVFGERESLSSLIGKPYSYSHGHARYIPMFEQVIPLGSMGYIDPFTKKFVVLIHSIPSILKKGETRIITDSKYSPSLAWDHEYINKSDVLRTLGVWIKGRSFVPSYREYLLVLDGKQSILHSGIQYKR